jgi:plasmid stabilization system protein ParE
MTGYSFHPEALLDLDEIWEFIRADSLDAADRMIAEILESIETLVASPNRGMSRPHLTSQPLRFILVREYLIAYARGKAFVGQRGHPRTAEPTPDGRDS